MGVGERQTKTERKKESACRGSNSRPQVQSCTQAIWTGGLFFGGVERKPSHYTQHTARSTPKLG